MFFSGETPNWSKKSGLPVKKQGKWGRNPDQVGGLIHSVKSDRFAKIWAPGSHKVMPITFSPVPGQILMCDFDSDGFVRPEMNKIRHCIVVSPKRSSGTCIIVPISTVIPNPVEDFHFQIPRGVYKCIDTPDDRQFWVKGDMITHASFRRLDRVREDGKFVQRFLKKEHLEAIQKAVLAGIGMARTGNRIDLTNLPIVLHSKRTPE